MGRGLATLLLMGAALGPQPVCAKVFLSVTEALTLAFPDCDVERETVFLTTAQQERAAMLAGSEIRSKIVYPYRAVCEDDVVGVAYFDTHRVRTMDETLMVVVDARSRVVRVEILSFREPVDYIPRGAWYDQFVSQPLHEDLRLKKRIRTVTGATLTARATELAVRRVLALHAVLSDRETR